MTGSGTVPPFDIEEAITREALSRGIKLSPRGAGTLACHALAVLRENPRLHLTSILEPDEFLERHLGESLEGAALLDPETRGTLVDVGSGNGYPGLPIALSHPGLRSILVEASAKKSDFLQSVISSCGVPNALVLGRQIQRSADLLAHVPVEILTMRAVGGWDRLLPRLAGCLSETGRVLLWAGPEVDRVRGRVAWRRLRVESRTPLSGRDRSWIWMLRRA